MKHEDIFSVGKTPKQPKGVYQAEAAELMAEQYSTAQVAQVGGQRKAATEWLTKMKAPQEVIDFLTR